MLTEHFLLDVVTVEAPRTTIDRKSAISLQRGQFEPEFHVESVAPTNHFARIVRQMNALKLCRRLYSHI